MRYSAGGYAELNVTSNFTFLKGASHPHELVSKAHDLGLGAIAITDVNSFAGIVRAHAAARELGIQYLVGVRLVLEDGPDILAYPKDRAAYGRLCRLLTLGKRRTTKGACELYLKDVAAWREGSVLILTDEPSPDMIKALGAQHIYLNLSPRYDGRDEVYFKRRTALAKTLGVPAVATGHVLMHKGSRRRLADILSCIRIHTTIDKLGLIALPNSERRLKSEFEMRRLFAAHPEALVNTCKIAQACRFSLDELRYEYPDEITNGEDPQTRLGRLTAEGLVWRYPDGVPLKVQAMVEKELRVIKELNYARYFLTVYDIVKFAREQNILCLLYTSPSPRDLSTSRMPSSA